jgi:hypothetical protein
MEAFSGGGHQSRALSAAAFFAQNLTQYALRAFGTLTALRGYAQLVPEFAERTHPFGADELPDIGIGNTVAQTDIHGWTPANEQNWNSTDHGTNENNCQ